ncbi:glycosyltransferase [Flavobacteriales bacterium]|nr:glycosyltransferase [Flavobacteriales bacterium]
MSAQGHRIVFLYSELAGYFLACAEALGQHPDVSSVDIVHWPIHPEAPFQFSSADHYTLHPKEKHDRNSLKQLLAQIEPTALVCSGWMDSDYNAFAKSYQKRIPVVLTFDNWWTGSLKQCLAALTAPWFIQRRFNRAWVPGEPQVPFAQKLGFSGKSLATGFYCADPTPFQAIYEKRKTTPPSKKILYIGRYLEVKGVRALWLAFMELSDQFPEWELHCIGTGELWDNRAIHPKIIHHGFKQPHELSPILEDAACFVMPSKKEPWGVVLHEMAVAGLPLLASTRVGASSQFLENGINGIGFDPSAIGEALDSFLHKNASELENESKASNERGTKHAPEGWSQNLLSLIEA